MSVTLLRFDLDSCVAGALASDWLSISEYRLLSPLDISYLVHFQFANFLHRSLWIDRLHADHKIDYFLIKSNQIYFYSFRYTGKRMSQYMPR